MSRQYYKAKFYLVRLSDQKQTKEQNLEEKSTQVL